MVNVGDVVLDGDGSEGTFLGTLATADAGSLASLHRHRALVFVDAGDEHSPTLRTLLAQFDDVARTRLDTGSARRALLFVNLRKSRLRVHVDSVKLAGGHTVATTQATKATGRLAGTTRIHGRTGAQSAVLGNLGAHGTASVTTYYGYHRLTVGNGHAQKVGHLAHHFCSSDRTLQPVDATGIGTLDQGVCQAATTSKATAATIGTGQLLGNLGNARVLIDGELLGADKQHQGGNQSDGSQYCYCNQHKIHK